MDLESNFPTDYSSKYSLVTFNEDIPYHKAMKLGRAQDKAILNLLDDGELNDKNLKETLQKVQEATNSILDDDKTAGLK